MRLNSINSNPTAFKAGFSYRVIPDINNRQIEKTSTDTLYEQAKNDDPKGYAKVMNFLDYMKSDEGIKKLSLLHSEAGASPSCCPPGRKPRMESSNL